MPIRSVVRYLSWRRATLAPSPSSTAPRPNRSPVPYTGRKLRKRDFRRLWITRINAAARLNGTTYSALMSGLKKQNININRKMLAEMAVNDAAAFAQLVEISKK